ncbi:phytanoyl-CoA dioxygenase family protein [Chloroflexi bacterium TSY]|nr:phytanoyl-CoA dioxygenase family protein [Chloroflexi bacterium TSY]
MQTALELDIRQEYDEKGYVIVRNAIDADLAQEMVDHIHWLGKKHPDVRPEALHHHLLVDDPFLHRVAGDDRLLDIAEQFIGPAIVLFGAHYIAKRPHTGQAVGWHQDGSYWPLEPMEVTTLWVAGTDSTVENGCMRVIPGTQNNRLLTRKDMIQMDRGDYVLDLGIHPHEIDESAAVDIELRAGDISIHNPSIIHGSNANRSDRWRVGLTLRYVPPTTWVKKEDHKNVLFRGEAVPHVQNVYVERPRFVEGEHMPFRGSDRWNE